LNLLRIESITQVSSQGSGASCRPKHTMAMPGRKAHTGKQLRGQSDLSSLTQQLQLEMRLAG
jgi:hypothetical protein